MRRAPGGATLRSTEAPGQAVTCTGGDDEGSCWDMWGGDSWTGRRLAGSVRLQTDGTYLGRGAVAHFAGSGSCTILLRTLWIWENLGRSPGSFCQQSSISRCRREGQFLGGGSRKPSSTALITWATGVGDTWKAT